MQSLPLLPVHRPLLFPNAVMPISITQPDLVAAIRASQERGEQQFVVFAERDGGAQESGPASLYGVGTLAVAKWMAPVDDGWELLVQGVERVMRDEVAQRGPYPEGAVCLWPLPIDCGDDVEALYKEILARVAQLPHLREPSGRARILSCLSGQDEPMHHLFLLGTLLGLGVAQEQALLEVCSCRDAARLLIDDLDVKLNKTVSEDKWTGAR